MRVCVVAGMPGAGKEEFIRVAIEEGYNVIRMGDVVRIEAAKRCIENNDRGIGGFAHSERQIYGYDIWARRTSDLIEKDPTIIDGCRGIAELEVFRRRLDNEVLVIAIHASPKTRFLRLRNRDREDAPKDWDEFMERDQRELGWGLGKVIATADYMIVNEGTLEDFKRNVREILRGIG